MAQLRKIIISLSCLAASLLTLQAQYPHVRKIRYSSPSAEPVYFKAIQDNEGYIWLGSAEGLLRFDGINFQAFRPTENAENMHISALHQASDGKIWAGCRDGRIFIVDNGSLEAFQPEEGTPGKGISDIIHDARGILWWSTFGEGIYFYEEGRVFSLNQEDGLAEDYVYDLEPAPGGMVWAATDNGVSLCGNEKGIKTVLAPAFNPSLPDVIVRVVRTDKEGKLWLGFHDAEPGYVDPEIPGQFISSGPGDWSYGPVSDLAVPGDEAWVATLDGSLFEMSSQGVSLIDPESFDFKTGKIYDLLEDREGNVWVLAGAGLFITSGSKLKFYRQFSGLALDNIHAIRAGRESEHTLYFSNDDGVFRASLRDAGISRMNLRAPAGIKVMSLMDDPQGYLWAGTFNYGVFRIDPGLGHTIRLTEQDGLINNNILSISAHHDTLWMATLGGATEIVLTNDQLNGPLKIRSFDQSNGLVSNYIYSVFEDRKNRIWFATDGDGISVLDHGRFTNFGLADGLQDDVVYSIAGDPYDNIWIATAEAGIYRYDGSAFHHYGIEEGLSSLDVSGMTASGDEVIVITDNGLDIIHIPTGKIIHYGEESGLSGITPDLNVISTDSKGNAWIGTRKGIIRYRPGSMANAKGPETVLEEMTVYLEPVAMDSSLSLKSNENHVSFRYSGIWFTNPEKVRYQVMLEGYDLGWKNTFDRSVTYSSLPPGHYTFRVRSSAGAGFQKASDAAFSFRIRQPFFMSAWFIGLAILCITALVYLFIKYRENKLRRQELLKKEKIEFEFQVLKNQVNPHFLFNSFSTLISLIEDQPDEAVRYTEKLSDFFRTILQLKDQEIIPLEEELTIVDHYFFLIKKRFGDNINLKINLEPKAKGSYIPPMTLQILLENAVKHNVISKDKPLSIRILSEGESIIVENNLQPKKTAEISTGIGLENITRRYRLRTDREPSVSKTEKVFRVKLPLIEG